MTYFEWLLPIKSHDYVIHSWQRVPNYPIWWRHHSVAYPSLFQVLTNPPPPTYTHPNTLLTFLDWIGNCATSEVLFYFYDIMDLHMSSLVPQGMFLCNGGFGEGGGSTPHQPKIWSFSRIWKNPPPSRLSPPKVNSPSLKNNVHVITQ